MKKESKQELNWLSKHPNEIAKYSGKWIAVLNEQILAKGDSVREIMKVVKKTY